LPVCARTRSVTAAGSAAVRLVGKTRIRYSEYFASSADWPAVSFAAYCEAFSPVIVNKGSSLGNGSM
jgi:hypothetical protein